MKYKVYISGYLEESNQLLVSFSSDDTKRDAGDYQAFAFDVMPYGNITAQEVIDQVAKIAPTMCSDIKLQEQYVSNEERDVELRAFVGQSFEYDENDLFPSGAAQDRDTQASSEAEQAEEI
jgi:hypothetical protein